MTGQAPVDIRTTHASAKSVSWAAVLATCAVLLISGTTIRALQAHYRQDIPQVTLTRGTLNSLSLTIEGWRSEEAPLDEAVVRATDTDDHLSRQYHATNAASAVGLYIAYGIRLRDLAPHRPEVCYPSAGWAMEQQNIVEIPLPDGTVLACQMHRFRKTGLNAGSLCVASYYIVDGASCADVSLLRSLQWRKNHAEQSSGPRYSVQVQVAASESATTGDPRETVESFLAQSAIPIRNLIEEALASVSGESPAEPVGVATQAGAP